MDAVSTQLAPLALWGGCECTINRVGDDYLDQSARSGHSDRPEDLDRLAGLGVTALRYPLLWESFAQSDQREALWAWHADRLGRLRALGIRPILGLIHHGSGPAPTHLLDPAFAAGLADHAREAAERFPWVQDWTPVNEPLTTARFSALYGHWYPHLRDETAFWTALVNQVDAIRGAMDAIRMIIPAARLVQTEDLGHTDATPQRAAQAGFDNHRRWATWDLLTGRLIAGHALWDHLEGLGLSDRLRDIASAPCPPAIIGLNHYLTSDRFLDHRLERHPPASHGACATGPVADVEAVRAIAHPPGLEGAVRAAWERYEVPIVLTEVHNGCTREEQMRWLDEAWTTATALRADGICIEAVTVWSLFGAFDWDSLLTKKAGHYESGVFDVRGPEPRETALAPMMRALAGGARPAHPVLHGQGWWRRPGRLTGPATEPRTIDGPPAPEARPLLILGATGTLGQAFAGACSLRDIDHRLVGRDVIDLHDAATIADALDRLRPWAVINCAGWVRVDEAEGSADACLATNFTGCVALAAACAQRDIHYSCFSSDLVFDGHGRRAYVESDAPAPLNVYGESKARAEAGVLAAGGRALVIRTASFFSPYDPHNFAMHLVAALRTERVFHAVGDCITSPTYVPDLVRATLDLVIDDECGIWHLTSDGAFSWAQFAHAVGERMDLPTDLIETVSIDAMNWPARRPRHASMSSERGLIMPSLASAIDRFALHLR
ncbi:dTDP-4-dehydrorhamnose reductase [Sphingobium sp. B1D7B]|uniref:sugar nucleotide-binding protein n=1 Tax=unclassified Sphingobium TaxID=2611147 RepID=UPI002224C556|nr:MULTISPECIES: sugar nucleotide-binding protein [unclassified Sphingobium]MCW2392752.1 dTDP-4-dehydrorhamnose reductase [Sphingobium sp. B11D3A]MCW2404486.1 dTDP-4-dehydrorhamnose reductase [Sphingobium sp. B1D7B]